ncbi:hypothetical protein BDB01DRAFT_845109 [Pilobolus umbonatus]|nr:hypothetical protein BDB01DRAFT_845109 [Pilobolus umbonatus]
MNRLSRRVSTSVFRLVRPWRSYSTQRPRHSWSLFKKGSQVSAIGFVGYTFYKMYEHSHPVLNPLPPDPAKKTVVILGSGWASTSLLKSIDTDLYNVIVVSPRNYFLFTPLLPSCTVGTVDVRSIVEPTRFITRHKKNEVLVYEAECTEIDPDQKQITIIDASDIKGSQISSVIDYDYLVIGVGAQNQTFGIEGVEKYGCFLKEVWDAQKIRSKLMDCIESAAFPEQSPEEVKRLLHMVVVGGGPTGIEYAAELHDFLVDDLTHWYPELVGKIKITLIEAMPNVLPAFSKQLIEYTESTFKEQNIDLHTKTAVKEVKEREIIIDGPGGRSSIPYGLLVWATGNTSRPLIKTLMAKFPAEQTLKRGLIVDDWLRMKGTDDIFVLGDASATKYAPTAQVASQQGKYLARVFSKFHRIEYLSSLLETAQDKKKVLRKLEKAKDIKPFHYSHQGSLCYVGSDKAIADLPLGPGNVASGGVATFAFWRSAYISNLFSSRNKWLVITDWTKKTFWGRDISRE